MSWWCESADVKLVRVSMTLIDVYLWVIVGSQKETGSGISRHASKQGNLGIQTNLRCMCVCVCVCVSVCVRLTVCLCACVLPDLTHYFHWGLQRQNVIVFNLPVHVCLYAA